MATHHVRHGRHETFKDTARARMRHQARRFAHWILKRRTAPDTVATYCSHMVPERTCAGCWLAKAARAADFKRSRQQGGTR